MGLQPETAGASDAPSSPRVACTRAPRYTTALHYNCNAISRPLNTRRNPAGIFKCLQVARTETHYTGTPQVTGLVMCKVLLYVKHCAEYIKHIHDPLYLAGFKTKQFKLSAYITSGTLMN